jgi:hypothetical protein
VVSVTTDGFITDKADLESLLLKTAVKSPSTLHTTLMIEYRKMRDLLSGDPTSLELKHVGTNLMSWTTRGQLSVEMQLKAITGLQTKGLDQTEI